MRNLIHRTNVPLDPEDNMKAAEDFLLVVLHAHVVAAANELMQLLPCESAIELAKLVITNYVHFPQETEEIVQPSRDLVYLYATELLTFGLLWHGFHDATCEGNGERLLSGVLEISIDYF